MDLDLSTEREGPSTQKSLYSAAEWDTLKMKYKPIIERCNLDPAIIKKLKSIEKVNSKFEFERYQI